MSELALLAEYGLDGSYGVCSVNWSKESSARSPNTSSVEMWWRRFSCLRTASSRVKVPTMLLRMNGDGSFRELSTCDSAAKWTTTSQDFTRPSTSSASQMSPWTNVICSATGARLLWLPAYVSAS